MLTDVTTKRSIMKIKHCRSIFSKAFGVMFRRSMDRAYVFHFQREGIIPLHMFFVFFPIDIIFLDSEQKVVEVVHGLKSWRMYMPKKKAKYVIELPAGTVKERGISVGHTLKFQ
ncbi:MAG: DUF192 domain-containing protein [Nanoarchaeota archaeon]